MSLKESEEELFQRWSLHHGRFVRDGVVDSCAYMKSKIKLLFLLKEVNDPRENGEDWDLREFIRESGRAQSWDTVTRWVLGIRALPRRTPWSEIARVNRETRQSVLRSIAAMNLKKHPGGHTTNVKELWRIAERDAHLIREQIELYSADIIICCGSAVYKIYREYLQPANSNKWEMCTNGVEFLEHEPGKFALAYSHPAARVSKNLLQFGLIDALHEIRGTVARKPTVVAD